MGSLRSSVESPKKLNITCQKSHFWGPKLKTFFWEAISLCFHIDVNYIPKCVNTLLSLASTRSVTLCTTPWTPYKSCHWLSMSQPPCSKILYHLRLIRTTKIKEHHFNSKGTWELYKFWHQCYNIDVQLKSKTFITKRSWIQMQINYIHLRSVIYLMLGVMFHGWADTLKTYH